MKQLIVFQLYFLTFTVPLFAQLGVIKGDTLTLQEAVKFSENNYPSIHAKTLAEKAAFFNLKLQRQDLIPVLDVNIQANTATLNNTYGLMYPQNIILPISGPVTEKDINRPVWGSAGGILLSWQPVTFGERTAKINLGKAALDDANNDLADEIFNHDLLLISAWLNYFEAVATVQTQHVNLERTLSVYTSVKSLANSGLKPGVDSFIVKGEISKASILLNKAIADEAAYKVMLAELLGIMDTSFVVSPQNILTEVPLNPSSADSLSNHPLLRLYQSKIEIANGELAVITHEYRPKLSFFTSYFARGSGASIDGNNDYSLKGLSFNKYNYAIGAMLSFPILQFFSNRTKSEIQQYNISAMRSEMGEQELLLKRNEASGAIYIRTSIENYSESKKQLLAATEAYKQMNVRYQRGLTTLPELFQVQYELAKAEEENAIALITIWKSYLYYTQATGNINSFLNQVK